MRLWTIQTIDAWRNLQHNGILRTDPSLVDDYMLSAYRWMVAQMQEYIAPKPPGCCLPIWAWHQWQGKAKARPDLRSSAHLPKGSQGVLLEIELDDAHVLLSDFELWHYVLNYWYLPKSEEDGKLFEAELTWAGLCFYTTKPLPDASYHKRMEESWLRIFDLGWSSPDIASPREEKQIQAVFWELHKEYIQSTRQFTAR